MGHFFDIFCDIFSSDFVMPHTKCFIIEEVLHVIEEVLHDTDFFIHGTRVHYADIVGDIRCVEAKELIKNSESSNPNTRFDGYLLFRSRRELIADWFVSSRT